MEATFRSLAARLRAGLGLKTPDAIHVATSMEEGCGLFLTNDLGLRSVTGLPVGILSEAGSPETA